jgi:intracellular septation protein
MKFLFDFFPLLVFFGTFKFGEHYPAAASAFASNFLSGLIPGGVLIPGQAPIMMATAAVVVATSLQVLYIKLRGQKVDGMLWMTFGVITVFGGATLYFNNENFIKWKPTILYWGFAVMLFVAQFGMKKNLIRQAMEKTVKLPESVWPKVGMAWMTFFAVVGLLNLLVAFVLLKGDTAAWVNFKVFGITGFFLVFVVGLTLFLSKYMEEESA